MTALSNLRPPSRRAIRHLPAHLQHERAPREGVLTQSALCIGQTIAVHVVGPGGKELYSQLYYLTGVPYCNDFDLWVVDAREGPYSHPEMNRLIRGSDGFSRVSTPISLWDIGIRRGSYKGVEVWTNRYVTLSTVPLT